MRITQTVKTIRDWYEGDPPGVKANLARIRCTGRGVILPAGQGFELGKA
jgi:class I fructose-bisphosphate aldolase